MSTAFVLSGGGSLGAVQVGMLQALSAHGIEPDLLVGTSAGAMNAAWVGAHGTSPGSLAGLAEVWGRLRRRDVFPVDVRTALRGILGRSPAVTSPERLRALVTECAGIATLEEARIPLHLIAADLLSGQTVTVSTGPLVTGVLASAAIPGVFPPVVRDGRHLIDGGVAHHTGVAGAAHLGATVIYVLPTGIPCALPSPPPRRSGRPCTHSRCSSSNGSPARWSTSQRRRPSGSCRRCARCVRPPSTSRAAPSSSNVPDEHRRTGSRAAPSTVPRPSSSSPPTVTARPRRRSHSLDPSHPTGARPWPTLKRTHAASDQASRHDWACLWRLG